MGDAANSRGARVRLVRRGLLVAALAAALSLGVAVTGEARQPQVVLIGDSVTAGWGASDAQHSWTSLLGVPVSGTAAPGAPSAFFLGQAWSGDTVVVELGINDCQQGVPPAVYADHMRTILGSITARRVVLVVPYETGSEPPGSWAAYANALYAFAPTDARVALVDLRPAFGAPSTRLLAPDLVHPNDLGHAVIASLVAAAIRG